MKKEKSSAKSDALRELRERHYEAQQKSQSSPPKPIPTRDTLATNASTFTGAASVRTTKTSVRNQEAIARLLGEEDGDSPGHTVGFAASTAGLVENSYNAPLSPNEGVCSSCGELRALRNGLVVFHGGGCAGSKRPPRP